MARGFFDGWPVDEIASHGFIDGAQWTAEAQAKASKAWGEALASEIAKPSIFNKIITGMPPTEPKPLYTDGSGGFQFNTNNWKVILRQGERERFYDEAVKHRDEAIRRMVETRLDGRSKEAEHWEACYRFLENSFRIPKHE